MKKHIYILLLFTYLLVLGGCSSIKKDLIPTSNKGGYKVNIIKEKSKINSDEVNIIGKVFDVKTGNPISNAELTIGCLKIQSSSQGEYSFKTENPKDDYFFIKVISVGYKTIETDFIDLTNKNQIKIDFYLAEDDRPFTNCEGVDYKLRPNRQN
jgi:hypothetical protein